MYDRCSSLEPLLGKPSVLATVVEVPSYYDWATVEVPSRYGYATVESKVELLETYGRTTVQLPKYYCRATYVLCYSTVQLLYLRSTFVHFLWHVLYMYLQIWYDVYSCMCNVHCTLQLQIFVVQDDAECPSITWGCTDCSRNRKRGHNSGWNPHWKVYIEVPTHSNQPAGSFFDTVNRLAAPINPLTIGEAQLSGSPLAHYLRRQ